MKSILYEKLAIFCKHTYGEKKILGQLPEKLKWYNFFECDFMVKCNEAFTKHGIVLKMSETVEENIKILGHLENIASFQYTIIIGAEDFNGQFPDSAMNINNFNDAVAANNLLVEYESDF